MGYNRVTKGSALAGRLFGTVASADAVNDAAYNRTITAYTSTSLAVSAEGVVTLASAGSSVGNVFTIGVPAAGQHHVVVALSGVGGSSKPTCLKSTSAAFSASSTQKVIQFNANGEACEIIALSATRWLVWGASTGVVISNTT